MRILITWGSERGGTEGIAHTIGDELRSEGLDVDTCPARDVEALDGYGAVLVGGALYGNRWHADARRFVMRHTAALRRVPVWLFSSGPLDDSAEHEEIPPTEQVQTLAERVGALGHATFGGRLAPDAKGFPASAMAKNCAGDWRNPDQIRAWAASLACELPTAEPGVAIDHPARSVSRVVGHGLIGWALCAAVLAGLLAVTTAGVALVVHAIAAPIVFVLVSARYFAARGTREPVFVALAFAAIVAALHFALAPLVEGGPALLAGAVSAWVSFALVFAITWITGFARSTMPWRAPENDTARPDQTRPASPLASSEA